MEQVQPVVFDPRAAGEVGGGAVPRALSLVYLKGDVEDVGGKGVQTACKCSSLTGEELSQLIKVMDNIAVTVLKQTTCAKRKLFSASRMQPELHHL